MDPDVTLDNLRKLSRQMGDAEDSDTFETLAGEFVNAFADLDEWMSKGGFAPAAWQRGQ